jgi:hypothetical protein
MTTTIGVLDFVKRQTPESKYNHFEGSWEELAGWVERCWPARRPSPHNPGVMLVPMPESIVGRFRTSIVEITPTTPLRAEYAPRVEGEAPFIQISAPGHTKMPARRVDIILYSHEVLARDGDAPSTREADFYMVSINAYASTGEEPMHPMTMARNFLGLKGGTLPEVPYTAQEFAEAVVYWNHHARVSG